MIIYYIGGGIAGLIVGFAVGWFLCYFLMRDKVAMLEDDVGYFSDLSKRLGARLDERSYTPVDDDAPAWLSDPDWWRK